MSLFRRLSGESWSWSPVGRRRLGVSVREAAFVLGLSEPQVRRRLRTGRLVGGEAVPG
jgi:hypothetical protein